MNLFFCRLILCGNVVVVYYNTCETLSFVLLMCYDIILRGRFSSFFFSTSRNPRRLCVKWRFISPLKFGLCSLCFRFLYFFLSFLVGWFARSLAHKRYRFLGASASSISWSRSLRFDRLLPPPPLPYSCCPS